MKKLLAGTLLLVAILAVLATTSMAATNADLIKYLTSNHDIAGDSVGITAENRVRAKRYLTENPATDEQAAAIITIGEDIVAFMNSVNVSDPGNLSKQDKEIFMAKARKAADIIGLKLVFHPHSVDVYDKDGKLIDNVTLGGELVYTGNRVNVTLVISSIAAIALVAVFVAKKRIANE